MKLISLSSRICLLILLILKCNIVYGEEEEVDIWKNSKIKKDSKDIKTSTEINSSGSIFKTTNEVKNKQFIEENIENRENEIKVYGIYDPEDNNFKLQMWANTKPSEIKNIIKRIDKLQLSNFSKDIFI